MTAKERVSLYRGSRCDNCKEHRCFSCHIAYPFYGCQNARRTLLSSKKHTDRLGNQRFHHFWLSRDLRCHSAIRQSPSTRVRLKQQLNGNKKMNQILRKAMQRADDYVIEMDYSDAMGNRTHRIVSPIRFMGSRCFLGLCLCREQPRQFQLSRCKNLKLIRADQVLMPVPMA